MRSYVYLGRNVSADCESATWRWRSKPDHRIAWHDAMSSQYHGKNKICWFVMFFFFFSFRLLRFGTKRSHCLYQMASRCDALFWFHLSFVCVCVFICHPNRCNATWSISSDAKTENQKQCAIINHRCTIANILSLTSCYLVAVSVRGRFIIKFCTH